MVKVKILIDGVKGADDGATVRAYPMDGGPDGDGVYIVSEALAAVFIEVGEAEEIVEKKQSVTDKVKAKKAAASEPTEPVKEPEQTASAASEPSAPAAQTPEPNAAPAAPVGLPGLPSKASGK